MTRRKVRKRKPPEVPASRVAWIVVKREPVQVQVLEARVLPRLRDYCRQPVVLVRRGNNWTPHAGPVFESEREARRALRRKGRRGYVVDDGKIVALVAEVDATGRVSWYDQSGRYYYPRQQVRHAPRAAWRDERATIRRAMRETDRVLTTLVRRMARVQRKIDAG